MVAIGAAERQPEFISLADHVRRPGPNLISVTCPYAAGTDHRSVSHCVRRDPQNSTAVVKVVGSTGAALHESPLGKALSNRGGRIGVKPSLASEGKASTLNPQFRLGKGSLRGI